MRKKNYIYNLRRNKKIQIEIQYFEIVLRIHL